MSEFIPIVGATGGEMTVAEHSVSRLMAGDVEAARGRLVHALESLGYSVISESPLLARRGKLKDIVRADFTEHARKLSVGLRQRGAAATEVTFEFAVTHGGCSTKGDLLTLEREADAVVALAAAPPAASICRSCGTENGGDARFCRLCGAAAATAAPAELELLRLTAASRAGLQEVVSGLFIVLLTVACVVPMVLYGSPKAGRSAWFLLAAGQAFGWWMTIYGILRTHRALNRRPEAQAALPAPAAPQFKPARTSALPPAHLSVTEGTTELLGVKSREGEPVVARRGGDTDPLG